MIDPTTVDGDIVLFCAFRYALGRQTYVVGSVVDAIERHVDSMTPARAALYAKEIDEADERDALGCPRIDAPQWRRLRANLQRLIASGDPPKDGE